MLARKLFFNFSSQFLVNILSQLLGLLTLPYITRILGPEKFGEYNLAASFLGYLGIFASFGYTQYVARELPRLKDVSELVNPTQTLYLMMSTLGFTIMLSVAFIVNAGHDFFLICIVLGIGTISGTFGFSGVFIAKDQLFRVSYLRLIGQSLFIPLMFIIIKNPDHLVRYALLNVSCYVLLPNLISSFLYFKYFGKFKLTLKYNKWPELRKDALHIGFTNISSHINAYFGSMYIGLAISTTDLGYYTAAFKIFMLFNVVYNLLQTVVWPTISRLYITNIEKLKKFLIYYLYACVILGIGSGLLVFTFADLIITLLYGSDFSDAIILLKVFAIGLLPLTPLAILFAGSLIPCNGAREFFYTSTIGSIVSIIFTFILSGYFGLIGVVVSVILSELAITIVGALFLVKKINIDKKFISNVFFVKMNFKEMYSMIVQQNLVK